MAESKINPGAPQKITDYINRVEGESHVISYMREKKDFNF